MTMGNEMKLSGSKRIAKLRLSISIQQIELIKFRMTLKKTLALSIRKTKFSHRKKWNKGKGVKLGLPHYFNGIGFNYFVDFQPLFLPYLPK